MEKKELIDFIKVRLKALKKLEEKEHPLSEDSYFMSGQISELEVILTLLDENFKEG